MHRLAHIFMHKGVGMRTTLDIPEDLMNEAMSLTNSPSKTALIKMALSHIIQKNKIKSLKDYKGKFDLGLKLDALRSRNEYTG